MYKIIQKRRFLIWLSAAILIPGIIVLAMYGLKLGIDFTGGSRLTVQFSDQRPDGPVAAKTVDQLNFGKATVQTAGDTDLVIRLPSISNDQRQQVLDTLQAKYGTVTELSFESIGPTIGKELLQKAWIALALVMAAIVAYISWAFRNVNVGPVPAWAYGVSAILALVHDVLIVIGVFALLGHFRGVEVDSLFVTALLTVLGFSVHDTIVVFDRIRERLLIGGQDSFEDTVNVSLNQTLIRSINTSFTTLLVLAVLYIFGGSSISNFVLALLIGIISGTYSSIFVASPLLVIFERWRARRRR